MRGLFEFMFSVALAACLLQALHAQDLAPRAYIITPVHWNAATLTYSFSDGAVLLNGSLPVKDGTALLNIPIFTYFHSLSFVGRSANFTASLPYGVGNFQGTFMDNETKLYRSGLLDSSFRFSVNLKGGPAMSLEEYQSWKQKIILGLSFRVVVPPGQYDPPKLANFRFTQWSFKPQFASSPPWAHS